MAAKDLTINQFSDRILFHVFLTMMTNRDANVYYNKLTNDIQQEVNGYLSSSLTEDQSEENAILANRILSNAPKDHITPGIHFLIPRMRVDIFCSLMKQKGQHIEGFNYFVEEFVEVQLEKSSRSELLFNDYLTNLFLSHLNEWCEDTGTNVIVGSQLFDETGKELAINYLKQI